jgi:hypothetical protein
MLMMGIIMVSPFNFDIFWFSLVETGLFHWKLWLLLCHVTTYRFCKLFERSDKLFSFTDFQSESIYSVCSLNLPTSEQAMENCFSLSESVLEVAGQPDHVEPFFLKI